MRKETLLLEVWGSVEAGLAAGLWGLREGRGKRFGFQRKGKAAMFEESEKGVAAGWLLREKKKKKNPKGGGLARQRLPLARRKKSEVFLGFPLLLPPP